MGGLVKNVQIKARRRYVFRDIQAFNIAMLAKQGWRMLSNPSSLMAHLYKVNYYPNGDVLNASLGSPSYAYKSIHKSLEVIKQGTRLRVGKKMSGWKEKLLSIGRREILIKAVSQAVLMYTMGCFLLPKSLCEDIEGMMRNL